MPSNRKIIEIDEELCTGCGQCILDCAEGALELVDGKARLVGEVFCDGLGACLSGCPTGALQVIERPAEEFDLAQANQRLKELGREPLDHDPTQAAAHACPGAAPVSLQAAPAGGRPGHAPMTLSPAPASVAPGGAASTLGHWPIKLQLLNPAAPFLRNADLLLVADCAAASLPDLHARFLAGKAIALACPKLDNAQAHIDKLASLLAGAGPKSLSVLIMEVPCCKGLDHIARQAMAKAGVDLPLGTVVVSRTGKVIHRDNLAWEK